MGDICAGRLKKETHREIAGGLVTWVSKDVKSKSAGARKLPKCY
jgi:hypothetical protein